MAPKRSQADPARVKATRHVQSRGRNRRRCGALLPAFGVLATASLAAMAQDNAQVGGRGLVIVPSISVTQTVTNNVRPGSGDPRSDTITQVTPGLRLSTRSSQLEADLDYGLSGVLYARGGHANNVQQNLAARLKAALIQDFAFIETRASISQQSISALGSQTPSTALANDNRTEVSTIQVSPYLQGRLGDAAAYSARLSHTITRSSQSENGDSTSTLGSLGISSASTTSRLGWYMDFSDQSVDYSAGRQANLLRLIGGISFRPMPDLSLSVRAGRESNDLMTSSGTGHTTSGWSVSWIPSERTTFAFDRDKRFFGSSYSLRFEHRTPRTVWRVSSTRGINSDPLAAGALPGATTVYDLLFQQFASLVPDPVQRAALVNDYLRNNSLSGGSAVVGNVLSSAATEDRRNEISFALLGLRNSIVVVIYDGTTRRLDQVVTVVDDFSGGNEIQLRGVGITASHRLTPLSSLSLGMNLQDTNSSLGGNNNRLRSVTLGWTSQLAPRVILSIGARRALFENSARPYSESAAFATLSFTF